MILSHTSKKLINDLFTRNYSKKIGKTALVTGASTGIGFTACDYLLQYGIKNLVLASSNPKKGQKALDELSRKYPEACLCYCKCDVTKKKDVKCLFHRVKELQGTIDVFFNNAGIFNEVSWHKMIKINLIGVVRCFNEYCNVMSKEKGGKGGTVINCASILGMQPLAGAPVYTGTKHFVIGFTRSYGLPWCWKNSNIRVMAVCPGVTLTPLISQAAKDEGKKAKQASKELQSLPKQHVCFVGEAIIQMLLCGKTGSIWVTEGEEIYEVHIPDRRTFRV